MTHEAVHEALSRNYLTSTQARALGLHAATLTAAARDGRVRVIALPTGNLYLRADVEILKWQLDALYPRRHERGSHRSTTRARHGAVPAATQT
jgi:hypothetical protein